LARIDSAEYVRNLANYLFRSYGVNGNVIKLKINIDDVVLGIDTAVPCGLMLNELVSNSLKHAFPGGRAGEICIGLSLDNDKFTLMVGDNGVGFPKDLDFRNTQSLGLQLVTTLVDQLEGAIELDGSGGTAVKIMFSERS
jgi:two-component sensor histidine kinase